MLLHHASQLCSSPPAAVFKGVARARVGAAGFAAAMFAGAWPAVFADAAVGAGTAAVVAVWAAVVPGAVPVVGPGTDVFPEVAAAGAASVLAGVCGAAAEDVGGAFLGGLLMPNNRCRPCLVTSPNSILLPGSVRLA